MTDRLEMLLRETYASDAAQAPLAGDLADGARHRATATRRRHAAITASALAVTAAVVGAAVAFGPSTDQGTPEPGASTPAALPTPVEHALFGDVEMGTLSLQGVSVPVPADWLIGESSDCAANRDSAYIFVPPAGAPCPGLPVRPNTFTTVRLAPWPDPGTPAQDVTTRLEVGSTRVVRHLGDVVLIVTSPDAELAQAIAASATVNPEPTSSLYGDAPLSELTLNGVSVVVPMAWIAPGDDQTPPAHNECYAPVANAAYLATYLAAYCPAPQPNPARAKATTVALFEMPNDQDAWPLNDQDAWTGEGTDADGRTQVSVGFPEQRVMLVVTSPDAELARAIAASATVNGRRPTASPDPSSDPALDGVLSFGGVQVPVPADWLNRTHLRCGTAIDDAAWVAIGAVEACLVVPPHPERVSTAVLEQQSSPPPGARPGETTLADGRTQIWSNIPGDAELRLVVTSPDADLARQVFDGLVIVDRPDGCAMTLPAQPDAAGGGTLVPDGMIHGQICSYVGSEVGAPLGYTHTLTAAEAQQLSAALNAAPVDDRSRDCTPLDQPPTSDSWVVSLSGAEGATATVVVATDACGMTSAASSTGVRSRLNIEAMSALSHLAPAILGVSDVLSAK